VLLDHEGEGGTGQESNAVFLNVFGVKDSAILQKIVHLSL